MAINYRVGLCCVCKKDKLIVKRKPSGNYCNHCNSERLAQERESKIKKPTKKRVIKPTGEAKLFKAIWAVRPHVCENCGVSLGNEARSFYFAHKIPKGRNEELRLQPSNIMLLCFDCHFAYDMQGSEKFNSRKA